MATTVRITFGSYGPFLSVDGRADVDAALLTSLGMRKRIGTWVGGGETATAVLASLKALIDAGLEIDPCGERAERLAGLAETERGLAERNAYGRSWAAMEAWEN